MNRQGHSVSVAGVTVDADGRILIMQRRDNGHWEAPGGILDVHETPEAGVRREVSEETGVSVHVDHLTGVYKNLNEGVIALVYRCSPVSGEPTSTQEAAQVRWVTRAEVDQLMTPAYAIRVHDAFGDHAASRHHDGTSVIPHS